MGSTLVGHWRLPASYELLHLARDDIDGLPSHWRRKLVPKVWYFLVNTGAVFFLPFLSIYWRKSLSYSTQQIGLLQALRPWVSAASGNLLLPVADVFNIHYAMLLATYGMTIISRGLMTLHWGYGMTLFLALVMEGAVSPMSTLVDATVVAGSTKDGTYGRARLWASVGWGAFAPVAGVLITKFGIHTSFMTFAAVYAVAFLPTALIPAGLLGSKRTGLSKGPPLEPLPQDSGSKTGTLHDQRQNGHVEQAAVQNVAVVTVAGSVPQPHIALSTATRRRSHRSEAHGTSACAAPAAADGEARVQQSALGMHGAVTCDFGIPRPVLHLTADARSSAEVWDAEVTVGVTVKPATATPAKGFQADACPSTEANLQPSKSATEVICDDGLGAATTVVVGDAEVTQGAGADEGSLWSGLRHFFSDVYVLTFMFKALLMGVANGFIGYLFLILSDQGASGLLLGLCLTMNCLAEVPVFYYSGALITRLQVAPALNLAMGAYCLRLGAYALIPYYPSLWIVLPVELLQGATFALAWSAGTVHCRRIAPKRLRSTVQSIFFGLYSGMGAGIGGLAGGFLYGAFGSKVMCEVGVGITAAGWALANGANLTKTLALGVRGGMDGVCTVGRAVAKRYCDSVVRNAPGTAIEAV